MFEPVPLYYRRAKSIDCGLAKSDELPNRVINFSIIAEIKNNSLVKSVDEEVKELVLVDFTVCLLWVLRHNFSKQTSQLTGFVKY